MINHKKYVKNVLSHHKKFDGIFEFFNTFSQQRRAKTSQRRSKDAAKTPQRRRILIKKQQRWARPHCGYIILILPVGTRSSLRRFLEVKSIFAGIFADLCKDAQRWPQRCQKRISFQNFMGCGVFHLQNFMGCGVYQSND